jgi:hypothetical protein
MQHTNKHTCNIRLEKTDETLGAKAGYIHVQHRNICMKHLQHTSETLETHACNMRFQRNISLLLGRIEARRRVEFTRRSGPGREAEKTAPTSSLRRRWMDLGRRAAYSLTATLSSRSRWSSDSGHRAASMGGAAGGQEGRRDARSKQRGGSGGALLCW